MARTSRRSIPKLFLLGLAAVLAGWVAAEASTVVPMTVPTLADQAGQVIVGRVAAVRSYWAEHPRRIESEVTLEGVEYLKGRRADSTDRFTLVVPGGEIDKTRMSVCCAPDLRVGEKWMLFLLPTYHNFPVVGISQGAFLVRPDADGVERVVSRTHDRESAVVGVGADGFVQYAPGGPVDVHEYLLGAEKMRLVTPTEQKAQPMAYTDFVAQLAPALAASRDHQLKAPAGKPDIVEYRGVPLQPSRLEQRRRAESRPGEAAPPLRGKGDARRLPAAPPPAANGEEVPQ
jgi:hypothetical protein